MNSEKEIKNNNQNDISMVKALGYICTMVWKRRQGKPYFIVKVIMSIVNAVYPMVFTIFPGLFINELINQKRIEILLLYISVLTICPVVYHFLTTIINRYIQKISMNIEWEINEIYYRHQTRMDYESFENPDTMVAGERASNTLGNSLALIERILTLFTSIFSLILLFAIISSLHPLFILLIVAVSVINSLFVRKANRKTYKIGKELSQVNNYVRSAQYMIDTDLYAKEVRLFHLTDFLMNHWKKYMLEYNDLKMKKHTAEMVPGIAATVLNFFQYIILYAYLIMKVLRGAMPVGNVTIYLTSVEQVSNSINNVVNTYLALSNDSMYINETIEYMNIPHRQMNSGNKTPILSDESRIEFKNVSFQYPGSENYAIKDLSISINIKEKLCIVGVNGSGKSTFIKLLSRLYYPTSGEILLDGVNIYEYDYDEYQKLFSVVFQDFCGYFMPISDNIVLAKEYDKNKLDKVCKDCALDHFIENLNKGYDTQIGKWIDDEGILPSGGEFQKIAIARAMYNNAPIYLLDEPTAALDPIIEQEIYQQFNNMTVGKSAILISHRLSSVQLADKVAVFDDGQIIEYGTHAELYAKGGKYKEMFDTQSEFYVKAANESNPQDNI